MLVLAFHTGLTLAVAAARSAAKREHAIIAHRSPLAAEIRDLQLIRLVQATVVPKLADHLDDRVKRILLSMRLVVRVVAATVNVHRN